MPDILFRPFTNDTVLAQKLEAHLNEKFSLSVKSTTKISHFM
jgi:hypothetical protein